MLSIETFIDSEVEYFRPMHLRSHNSSQADRDYWKTETIRQRQERISLEVFDLCDGTVRYGPFKGLKLNRDTWWGKLDLGNQCLGLYEKELLHFFQNIRENEFSTLIDIGAADGYYAVGALVSGIFDSVICFEQSASGRETIHRNWENNGSIGNLSILGAADANSIAEIPESRLKKSLLIVDIEGAEFNLLTDQVLDKLQESTIVVEIHNWVDGFIDLYADLLRRANKNHQIHVLERIQRSTTEIPELRDFTDDNRLLVTSERRPCLMRFLLLQPRA